MKYRFIVFILVLMPFAAYAQKDLNCWGIFHGDVVPREQMVRTEVRGGEIRKYMLDHYLGLSFRADDGMLAEVSELLEADSSAALSSEIEHVGPVLTYALLQMQEKNGRNRFVCYQASRDGDHWRVILLYLEGPASLEDLKSMFEKQ